MDQEFSSESDIAPSDDKSWKPSSNSDETETISDSEEEVDENNNKMQANSTGLVISNTYSYVDLTEEDPGVVQILLKFKQDLSSISVKNQMPKQNIAGYKPL